MDLKRITQLIKRDFFCLFWVAYYKAFTPSNIESGQKKTRIYPFYPIAILEKFLPKKASIDKRPLSSESSKSVLITNDWKKIKQKLKAVITDVFDS